MQCVEYKGAFPALDESDHRGLSVCVETVENGFCPRADG